MDCRMRAAIDAESDIRVGAEEFETDPEFDPTRDLV